MPSDPPLRPSRFALAAAVSAALVLSAPFIGYVRAWIRTQFSGQFVRIVGGLLASPTNGCSGSSRTASARWLTFS